MLGSLSNHDDDRVDDDRNINVKGTAQARTKNFVVHLSSTTSKGVQFHVVVNLAELEEL